MCCLFEHDDACSTACGLDRGSGSSGSATDDRDVNVFHVPTLPQNRAKSTIQSVICSVTRVFVESCGFAIQVLTESALDDIHQTRTSRPLDPESRAIETNQEDTMNKRIRTGLIGIALAGGTALGATQVGGVANAQEDPTVDTTVAQPADTDGEEQDGEKQDGRRNRLATVAELIGIEVEDLRTQLREGASLADVATANGVETQTVIDFIVGERTERIETKVAEGDLTREEADEKLEGLEDGVTLRVEEGRQEGDRGPRSNRRAAFSGVAEVIGVDAETLRTELAGGATVADVATANGVEVEAVVDVIVTERTERIESAVERGRLTDDEAAERLAGLEEQVTTRVEQGRPDDAQGLRGGQRGPRGPQVADAAGN